MAAKRKKSTARKNTRNKEPEATYKNEILLLVILAVCILLFISNFGAGGFIGDNVSTFFFGIFGLAAYIFPICVFIGVSFIISNIQNTKVIVIKSIAFLLFIAFLCLFIELVVGNTDTDSIISSYRYGAEHKNGGGFLGGALAILFLHNFGLIGTYVIDIVVLIISMLLITERSIFREIKKGSKKVYASAREDAIRYQENREIRKEKRNQKRMDKKVEGVSINTKIVPPNMDSTDNINELKPTTQPPPFTKNAMEKLFREDRDNPSGSEPEPVPLQPEQQPIVVEKIQKKPRATKNKSTIQDDVTKIEEKIQNTSNNGARKQSGFTYMLPPVNLLKKGSSAKGDSQRHLQETALKLQQTLKNFGVNVTITDVSCGPSVTRYEMQPEQGVKVSKIVNLADDIKLNLAASDIRIEAPIPGKAAVGIEVPNKENVMIRFRDMIEAPEFKNHSSGICFTAGKNIGGQVVVADIAKMPHLLIAGATGSGKSVCINTIIMSLLYKANPDDVKLILIDPKVVELSVYNGIPHLFIPVVTDPKKAAGALHWAVSEMTDRYQKFAEYQVRDLKGYNQKIENIEEIEDEEKPGKLPQIVIVVDELADLMMVAPGEVEDAICRLAQLARAAGIHLIIATQRPSVDVITGLIKANMPSRIAFSVSSGVDSRTILDMTGAEKLLGNGDMLFYPQGFQKPLRVQGPFVSDTEVEAVVDFLKKQSTASYNTEIEEKMNRAATTSNGPGANSNDPNQQDAYFMDAGKFVIEKDKGSIGMLQRWFKIGFNRAARIMDQLEEAGVVGPEDGTKPRKILMSLEQFESYIDGAL